jgi:hypothetical protein
MLKSVSGLMSIAKQHSTRFRTSAILKNLRISINKVNDGSQFISVIVTHKD